ncbi:MAG: hypothetical protein MK105_19550, partial [Crocinitomicaceae bacterium]|nr:hypothetical protein [Crocinitomicaceae bacterium]
FQLRMWDARIGRWLTRDPYSQYVSPYLGMGNDPVNGIDPDGGFKTPFGAFLYKLTHLRESGGIRFGSDKREWYVEGKSSYSIDGNQISFSSKRIFAAPNNNPTGKIINNIDYELLKLNYAANFVYDFGGGVVDFGEQFITMKYLTNFANSDKYFHSKPEFD